MNVNAFYFRATIEITCEEFKIDRARGSIDLRVRLNFLLSLSTADLKTRARPCRGVAAGNLRSFPLNFRSCLNLSVKVLIHPCPSEVENVSLRLLDLLFVTQ